MNEYESNTRALRNIGALIVLVFGIFTVVIRQRTESEAPWMVCAGVAAIGFVMVIWASARE